MQKGEIRADIRSSGLSVEIRHAALCPEIDPVTCAQEEEIPLHYHEQGLALIRTSGRFNLGIGRGLQVAVEVPIDVKISTIDYLLEDGSDYDPPYGNIHHRPETLWGPADPSVFLERYAFATPHLLWGGGVGVSLPLGRTEDDPFALAAQGLEHQHLQMGAGTFIPMISGSGIYNGMRLGGMTYFRARFPFYENKKGYTAAPNATLGIGPTYRLTPHLQALSTLVLGWEGAEQWNGETTDNEGKITLSASVGMVYMVSPLWEVQAMGRLNLWQEDLGAKQVKQNLVITLGVSRNFRSKDH